MTKIYLVRHGQARAGWGEDLDPGLNEQGQAQAEAAAGALAKLGPLEIISSPLARARETSMPLAAIWNRVPRIEARVGEIPAPGLNLQERSRWLIQVMAGQWPSLSPELQAWRAGVLTALRELRSDTVVFTHFIAINAAVGEARGDGRVAGFWPGNGSVTVMETGESGLTLIKLGEQADTKVG